MDFLRGCEGQGGPQAHRPEGGDSAERCGGGAAGPAARMPAPCADPIIALCGGGSNKKEAPLSPPKEITVPRVPTDASLSVALGKKKSIILDRAALFLRKPLGQEQYIGRGGGIAWVALITEPHQIIH